MSMPTLCLWLTVNVHPLRRRLTAPAHSAEIQVPEAEMLYEERDCLWQLE